MGTNIAILISVKETLLNFSNQATRGVDAMANTIQYSLSYAFSNIRIVQNRVLKQRIIQTISQASRELGDNDSCLIYFHGHGTSITGRLENDEDYDQALVCFDALLLDDELDQLLRSFHPGCRVLSIIDACSSESVIEWKYDPRYYPKVLHIASSSDFGQAQAGSSGGYLSQQIVNLVYDYGYTNFNYLQFVTTLKRNMRQQALPIFIRRNPKYTNHDLQLPLFK